MKKTCLLGLALALGAALVFGQTKAAEDGKYLVNDIGMCGDCHTPRLPNGEFDQSRWLKGTSMDFAPLQPVPNWEKKAPDLTRSGQLMWSTQQLMTFLQTGRNPKGNLAKPPMPQYRMRPQDAEAVVEYLKTLK